MPKPTKQLSDEDIARMVQSGKVNFFDILVKRYEAKMMRYGRKFLFNHNDVEDLIQGVFIKAYRNIQSFDASKKFSAWIYRIAHNEFINLIKKKGKEPVSFFNIDILLPHHASKESADKDIEKKELSKILDKCLDKIDQKYREPIILYYFEDLSYKEIADVLHIPIATVGIRLKRGREIMKPIYQKLNNSI
ncbi:MAG: RNA polymerase sigma factor [Patescibacteria group bacterium]|nr:RNA polymerase sigma factor [Patescibacteria group bacterium]